jgi:ABC-type spermidine/putrescine transport system permease subunit II
MSLDWSPLWQGLRVAAVATAVSAGIGLWLASALAGKRALAALASASQVIPAPIICYYVLALAGAWPVSRFGLMAAAILSASQVFLPGARAAFEALDPAYGNAARSLGASEWRVFSRVQVPLALRNVAIGGLSALLGVLAQLAFGYWLLGRLAR